MEHPVDRALHCIYANGHDQVLTAVPGDPLRRLSISEKISKQFAKLYGVIREARFPNR